MTTRLWVISAIGALMFGLAATPGQAASAAGTTTGAIVASASKSSAVQEVRWRHRCRRWHCGRRAWRRHRHYYWGGYYPRGYYRHRYYRPGFEFHGPGFSFYIAPRYRWDRW